MDRLAFSTNAFKKNTLDEAIRAIAYAGYRGVELMADVPHAYPPDLSSPRRSELLKLIASLRLAVSNINAFTLFADGDTYHPTWIEEDPERRDARVRHTLACIDLAADMQCGTVSLQPGGPLLGTGLSPLAAAERFAEGLSRVLPAARERGIVLAIEPEPGLLIQTSGEFATFKQSFFAGDDFVRMNCDVGHLFCVGEEPHEVIRAYPGEIAHVHLEDIGANRVHQHLAPGRGVIDFTAIFEALKAINYSGWVTVELYPYEAAAAQVARTARAHLAGIISPRRL